MAKSIGDTGKMLRIITHRSDVFYSFILGFLRSIKEQFVVRFLQSGYGYWILYLLTTQDTLLVSIF